MTTKEFQEEVKDFCPNKDDLKEKVMNYLAKEREQYMYYIL